MVCFEDESVQVCENFLYMFAFLRCLCIFIMLKSSLALLNLNLWGGGQPQTCWNLPFGDGEKWGKMGQIKNFEIHV